MKSQPFPYIFSSLWMKSKFYITRSKSKNEGVGILTIMTCSEKMSWSVHKPIFILWSSGAPRSFPRAWLYRKFVAKAKFSFEKIARSAKTCFNYGFSGEIGCLSGVLQFPSPLLGCATALILIFLQIRQGRRNKKL